MRTALAAVLGLSLILAACGRSYESECKAGLKHFRWCCSPGISDLEAQKALDKCDDFFEKVDDMKVPEGSNLDPVDYYADFLAKGTCEEVSAVSQDVYGLAGCM